MTFNVLQQVSALARFGGGAIDFGTRPRGRWITSKMMSDSWLKYFLEAPWSASLVVLIAAIIGGAFSFLASWFATRGSLKAQFKLQQQEWQRRDGERAQERAEHEQREKEERLENDRIAIRAVAIEGLFNSINLLGLAKIRLAPPDGSVIVSRKSYEGSMESLIRAADPGSVQRLTNLYASAIVFELSMPEKPGMVMTDSDVRRARELSQQFEVMFRTFGQMAFFKGDLDTFEMTLSVAKAELAD
jgi:hypothetical protein